MLVFYVVLNSLFADQVEFIGVEHECAHAFVEIEFLCKVADGVEHLLLVLLVFTINVFEF